MEIDNELLQKQLSDKFGQSVTVYQIKLDESKKFTLILNFPNGNKQKFVEYDRDRVLNGKFFSFQIGKIFGHKSGLSTFFKMSGSLRVTKIEESPEAINVWFEEYIEETTKEANEPIIFSL